MVHHRTRRDGNLCSFVVVRDPPRIPWGMMLSRCFYNHIQRLGLPLRILWSRRDSWEIGSPHSGVAARRVSRAH